MPIKCKPPESGREEIAKWAKLMDFTPDLDERATVLSLLGASTRLRLFYVLDQLGEVCVCDMATILGVTQSAVSQHVSKMKAYGLLSVRRDAQTLFYRLSDNKEVKMLRKVGLGGIER